jgi:glycosyltransferase involved in cell wall biosynthesis
MTELPLLSNNPLVSVIVPSFNQGRFIRATLDSILSQDYRPIEVIVVDGASTDDTVRILREYDGIPEVRWLSEPDSGVVEAVNKGFALAKGEIGAIQSSDDFYFPAAVRRGVEALMADPSLGFVFGDIVKIDADGHELSRTSLAPFSLENVLSVQTWIPQPSTFFRLELARSLGGWREEVPYAADTDLWFRIAFRAGARKLDAVLAARRLHDAQRDMQGARIIRDYTRMIDTLPGLPAAPERLRRAAAAGKLLMQNRYDYEGGYWAGWWRLCKACMIYPPLHARIDTGALMPGWYPLRALASRMKRAVTGGGAL